MEKMQPLRIKTISQYHQLMGLPKPEHPLISVVNFDSIKQGPEYPERGRVMDFYSISMKRNLNGKMKYGQQEYDFDEGILFFMSPGQVFRIHMKKGAAKKHSGWLLLVHPDFLWNTPLAKTIRHYEYFDYSVNEALFLSEKEELAISGLMQTMQQEYCSNIDAFSEKVIIAQLELLLTYSERFYQRQFITRKIANHQILGRLEDLLNEYFNSERIVRDGLPTVQFIAESLNISPNYLSGLLKTLTGKSTQQHVHDKVIEKAKEKLSTADLSVSEIAYELGFEHPQSFSKLFKMKTNLSPLEFRQSFN